MLEALRKSATGILAKILIALLVLSFAVWGIADVITGVGRSTIASVGEKEISIYEFRRQYQDQVDAVSRRFGRRLTPQQARAFGVEQQVLSTMIGSRAVDSHAEELNLSISGQAVEDQIRKDPLFQSNGSFDPGRLTNLLATAGYSEGQFISSRRNDLIREQLTGAMLDNVGVPKVLFEIMRTFQGERRKARYFTVDPKVAIKLETPTDGALRKIYDARKTQFMTDEARQIEILMITADAAKKRIKVTDEQLKERYERDKLRYSVPEQRQVLQIPFKDTASAEKARSEILSGKKFADVAKAAGAKESDIDLGLITKDKMIDPKIADAAFALAANTVSAVVTGRFTTVLLMVTKIEKGNVPKFAEIKDKLRDSITSRQAPDSIRTLHDQVDDNRLAGKTLKEIAALLDIPLREFASITQAGNGPDGKPAFESADREKILASAFDSAVGVENEVVELTGGGYAWARVLKVVKAEQKSFEVVKADVDKLWRDQETRAALTKVAQAYIKELEGGSKFADVAKKAGGEVKTTPEFKRQDSLPDLSAAAVNRAFAIAKGKPTSVASTNAKSRIIMEVTDILEPAKLKDADKDQLETQLVNQLRTDTVAQYVLALRNRLGVETNQRLIDQTVGIVTEGY